MKLKALQTARVFAILQSTLSRRWAMDVVCANATHHLSLSPILMTPTAAFAIQNSTVSLIALHRNVNVTKQQDTLLSEGGTLVYFAFFSHLYLYASDLCARRGALLVNASIFQRLHVLIR